MDPLSFFAAAEAATRPQPPAGAEAFPDFFQVAENPAGAAVAASVKSGKSWEESGPSLLEAVPGADPKSLEREYRTAFAKDKYSESQEDTARYIVRRSIPGFSAGMSLGEGIKTARAKARIEKGEATQDDYDEVAQRERLEQIDRDRGVGGAALSALARIPAIIGEAVVGGQAVRAGLGLKSLGTGGNLAARAGGQATVAAAATPLMPSTYLEQAVKRSEQNGLPILSWENLGVAGANAIVQNALLGHSMKLAGGIPTKLGKGLGGAAAGMAEQQGADAAISWFEEKYIPEAYQTRTRYGILGHLARGEKGEAMKAAATQAITFGFFSALQPGKGVPKSEPRTEYDPTDIKQLGAGPLPQIGSGPKKSPSENPVVMGFAQYVNDMAGQGVSTNAAGARASRIMVFVRGLGKNVDRQKAREAVNQRFKGPDRDFGWTLADAWIQDIPDAEIVSKPQLRSQQGLLGQGPERVIEAGPEIAPKPPGSTQPEVAPEARPAGDVAAGAKPEAAPAPPADVVGELVDQRQSVGKSPTGQDRRRSIRLGDPTDGGKTAGGDALTRFPLMDAEGKEIGHTKIFRSGDTVHVDWLGLEGKGGTDKEAKGDLGARELLRIAPQLAAAYPDAILIKYTPAEGRLKKGETKWIDLDKVRKREAAKIDSPEPPAAPGKPADVAPEPPAIEPAKAGAPAPKARPKASLANLKQNAPRTLANSLKKQGISRASLEALGHSDKDLEQSGWKGIIRANGGRHIEDVIPELQRSGDLPAEAPPDRHLSDILIEKIRRGDILAEDQPKAGEKALQKQDREAQKEALQEEWDATPASERRDAFPPEVRAEMKKLGVDLSKPFDRGAVSRQVKSLQEAGTINPELARLIDAEVSVSVPARERLKMLLGGMSYDQVGARTGEVSGQAVHDQAKKTLAKLKASNPDSWKGDVQDILDDAREQAALQMVERAAALGQPQGMAGEMAKGIPQGKRGKPGTAKKKSDDFTVFSNPIGPALDFLTRKSKWLADFRGAVGRLPLDFDTKNILPRFTHQGTFAHIFSTPEGMGRFPILARLFDPRGTEKSPEGRSIIARQAGVEIGKNMAALWAQSNAAAKDLFQFDPDGQMHLTGNRKGRLADVMEAELRRPGSQPITPEQRAWLNDTYKPLLKDFQTMLRDEGVAHFLDPQGNPVKFSDVYFPRPAIGKKAHSSPSGPGQPPRGPGQPGTKGFWQKSRDFTTEKEGAAEGILYDPDPISRVAKMVAGGYRAVADHRLANDPALQGHGKAVWLETRPAMVAAPAFKGKAYPLETAKKIEDYYAKENPGLASRALATANDFAKALSLGFDASVLFNQMLSVGMMGTHRGRPIGQKAWAKGLESFVRAASSESYMSRYLNKPENAQAARELVQGGSSVSRLTDFLAGMEQGAPAERLPVIGAGVRWSGRTFGAAIDTVKIELWKSMRDMTPPDQRVAVMQRIDSIIGSGRMEQSGLTPARALGERLLFLAPSLYRAGIDTIAGAARYMGQKVSGQQTQVADQLAIRAVMGQAFATALAAYAGMEIAGLSDDEKAERFNPASGKFMTVPVTLSDGSKVNVRFGNILMSYVRLMGDLVETQTTEDKNARGPVNVLLKWLRQHSSPAIRGGADFILEKDVIGRPISRPEAAAKAVTPIMAQDLAYDEHGVAGSKGFKEGTALRAGLGALGIQAIPENEKKRR